MSEQQKEKKLFYIQLMENFFESDELIMIEDSALDKGEDPSSFQMIYLKLILKSLCNDGLIKTDTVLTPQLIKTKIRFKTNRKREDDLKTIDEAIKSFEELGLVILSEQVLFVKKALELTMSKEEESQKRFLERRKNKVLIDELKLKTIDNLTDEQKERILFENKCDYEWIPGLEYCGYISKEEETDFKLLLEEIADQLKLDEISKAMFIFIKRSRSTDYKKVVDKKNYLFKTLYNIAVHEIRDDHDLNYDIIIDLLLRLGVIKTNSEIRNVLSILANFEREGNTKSELRNAMLQLINTADEKNILVLDNYGVSNLQKELERILRKENKTNEA